MTNINRLFHIPLYLFLVMNICKPQESNEEFRATWVITWEHIFRNVPAATNKALIRQIMDNHQKANMNAVIFQIRQSGTVYYQSLYEPWGYYIGYQYPGYDPLEYAIQQAHERGLELHAWFNVFQTSSTYPGSPAYEHPEWICRDQDGYTMNAYRSVSPGLKEVRDYTVNVAMEIVNNYDIDGLHLDYVRWNEHTNSKMSKPVSHTEELQRLDGVISREELDALSLRSGRYLYDYVHPYSAGVPDGFDSWEEWWRWSVTEFVRTLHDSIQAVKPHIRLSAAVLGKYNWSGWQAYGTVYQDAALWFNEGYVDQLMPMHYHWTTAQGFWGMLAGDCPECWNYYIQPGIQNGRLFSVGPGSYRLHENNVWGNHPYIVDICRSVPWVDGFQFFSYGSWDEYNYWTTAGNTFFDSKTKIRSIPENSGSRPTAPDLIITLIDSLLYDLTVIPSDFDHDYWFILYRSTENSISPWQSEIIDLHFGNEPYTIRMEFPYSKDSIIQYIATQSDRFRNESSPSKQVFASAVPLPKYTHLGQSYPNPFNSATAIPFSIPNFYHVKIDIYDITGRHVLTLRNKLLSPGNHTANWNVNDKSGTPVPSGIYFYQLKTGAFVDTKRMILIK